jgi:cation diffusion facilitator CzcD-associated flavoprotein CzcO
MTTKQGNAAVHVDALVIGTGFSGIGMGIALQNAGVDFLVLEKADEFGGTWRDNSYPGCACDIPSHLYSFSFEPNPDWKHLFSFAGEIEPYLVRVADKYHLRERTVFGVKVEKAEWSDREYRWHVTCTDGREFVCQFLISGVGALHIPSVPDIPGRDEFEGHAFHSAEWNHGVDLKGKRVAIVGTGASAIQIVPEIVDTVGELQLYQRTPAWVMPRRNFKIPLPARLAFRYIPGARKSFRFGIYMLQEAIGYGMTKRPGALKALQKVGERCIDSYVDDPVKRRQLKPDYDVGCKRILNGAKGYYSAINRQKTKLITDGIQRITPKGIVTADGTEHEADVIVWATGFHVADSYRYVDIKGRGGEDLVERWNDEGTIAHRGVTVAGMPNLFFLLGPNTGLGHNSVVLMIEAQIKYVVQAVETVRQLGVEALDPWREVQAKFNADLQRRLRRTVWNTGGCASWYIDEHGVNRVLWYGQTWDYMRATRTLEPKEYHFSGGKAYSE